MVLQPNYCNVELYFQGSQLLTYPDSGIRRSGRGSPDEQKKCSRTMRLPSWGEQENGVMCFEHSLTTFIPMLRTVLSLGTAELELGEIWRSHRKAKALTMSSPDVNEI